MSTLPGDALPASELLPAFAYGRVSDEDHQDEVLTIDTQLRRAEEAAARYGFYIVKWFRETGTATNDDRSQFQAMIVEAIAPGSGIKAIWFYDQSRFVRNETDFFHYAKVLTDSGVQLGSARFGLYGEDEYSRMNWGMTALMDARFSRDVARRTRDMQYGATREGYYLSGHAPFGYEKYKVTVGRRERTKLKPNLDQWHHGVKIYEMALNKTTPMVIAQYMDSMGVLTNRGKRWTRSSVLAFLRNPTNAGKTYRGLRQHSRVIPNNDDIVWCDNAHEGMVTPEQHDQVLKYIAERRSPRKGPRSYSSPNLLSKRIMCAHCGSPMIVQTSPQGPKLRCRKKKDMGAHTCPSKNVPLDLVMSTIIRRLLDTIITEETLEQQIKAVAQANQLLLMEQQTKRAEIKKNTTRLERRIKNLTNAIADDGPDEQYYADRREYRAQLDQLNAEMQEIDSVMGDHLDFLNQPERIISNALDIRTYLESDDRQTVRNLLQSFIQKVTIDNEWRGTIYYTVPLPSDSAAAVSDVQGVSFEKKGREKNKCLLEILTTMMFCRFWMSGEKVIASEAWQSRWGNGASSGNEIATSLHSSR
ncbi:MAG: recombinase family protein [Chloroflexi bacterium]|nr:recombinase family protein [Chloroflexota bacterium]